MESIKSFESKLICIWVSVNGNQQLQAAMDQASAGNLQGAKAALGSLLDDPQVKKMMQKLS